MARWAQVGFIAACFALVLGVYLGSRSGRSLDNLTEEVSVPGSPVESPVLSDGPRTPKSAIADPVPEIKKKEPASRRLSHDAKLEILEAKQSVLALLDENKKIRKEVLDLEGQIRRLTNSLAEEKLENDRLRVKIGEIQDKRSAVSVPGPVIPEVCEVIDVNEELNLVVLNRGSDDGIQHRMQLTVLRKGSRIAQLEAVNVRSRITGAAITFLKDSETIVAGDRVVPVRN